MKTAISFLFFSLALFAQTSARQVVLTWEDTQNPAGTTYSIYRSNGVCANATNFTRIANNIALKTYTDTANPGQYCYYATATLNSVESDASTTAEAKVKPFPPKTLTVTVQ